MTDNKDLLDRLNETGHLLQQSAFHMLTEGRPDNLGSVFFDVDIEEPFIYPDKEHGAIDLLATAYTEDFGADKPVVYAMECKRPMPEACNWVFVQKNDDKQLPSVIVRRYTRAKSCSLGIDQNIHFPDIGNLQSNKMPFAYNGVELHENLKKRNVRKDERTYLPLLQVARATLFTINYKRLNKKVEERRLHNDNYGLTSVTYLPILLTTADLYLSQHDYGDIDLESGTLPEDKSKIERVNWIAYQFPIWDYLRSRSVAMDYLTIFIVKSSYFVEFIAGSTPR